MKNNLPGDDDTIAAISTALGPGGIGIVRLSGAGSIDILKSIFRLRNGKRPRQFVSHKVYFGHIFDARLSGHIIDEVLVTVMRAPRSYTREDVVEINSHGGLVAVKAVLDLTMHRGARLALPGEFTKRAFLNGRIDLVQAESVLDIIQAKTQSALRVGTHQLKGELTLELEKIRTDLLEAYVGLEALLNFPEDGIEDRGRAAIAQHLAQAKSKIVALLSKSEQGRLLREGVKVVLCGRPNVGKSSLLNVLLKQPRAIVSEVAGTTRDTIEEAAQIRGIPLQLVDTAGILDPRDAIEQQAIARSHLQMLHADLLLLIVAACETLTPEDRHIINSLKGQNILVVINKIDLTNVFLDEEIKTILPNSQIVRVSATTRNGIPDLEEAIEKNILHGKTIDSTNIILSNVRHIESLKNAQQWINQAQQFLKDNLSLEFISENLKLALHALDRITGRDIDDDLLDNIFSSFCIGK